MNEKYGIELEAIVNKFKATMQSTANFVKNLGKKMEDDVTIQPSISADVSMTKKELENLRKELEREIEKTKLELEVQGTPTAKQIAEAPGFYTDPQKLVELEKKLKDVNSQIENYGKKTDDATENTKKLENESKKTNNTLGKFFKNGISDIKRFSFYLLGARSVFALFRKYQSTYNQYNEQMMYQTELSQNAIALSLGPAFEVLGNIISYVSIAFARFVELLTGVNVLSKVTTKGIRDYNKSLKETQTLVSGVDEITNLTTPNTMGLADQYEALEDFRKKVAEVREWFAQQEWIKKIKDNVDVIIQKFTNWYENGGKKALISIGNELKDIWNNLFDIAKTILDIFNLDANNLLKGLTLLISNTVLTIDIIASNIDFILKAINDIANQDFSALEKHFKEWKGEIGDNFDKLKENAQKAFEKTESFSSDTFDAIEKDTNNAEQAMEDFTKKDYKIEAKIGFEKNSFSKFKKTLETFASINGLFNPASKYLIKGALSSLSKIEYKKGLDYVPYDEYPALLHKGEAVVPAKYNPAIHSAGNDYTNTLLETLVTKMDDLASRPNVFEIDGQKFASATYGLYTSEEKRQNYNRNVVVR